MSTSRKLVWDGCVNVRDLGGHPTEDGGETVYGAVVRADNLTGLSDTGWEALEAYDIRRIVDLRWSHEVAGDAAHRGRAEVVHVSLFGDTWDGLDGDRRFTGIADYAERRRALYLDRLDRYRDRFARAIAAVAGAPQGCVAIHCAGGVDRTGLVAGLLLRLADVPTAVVAEDYARSEESWAQYNDRWLAEARDDRERERRRFLSVMPASAMAGALDVLDARYGGVAGYLRRAGAGESDLRAARVRLRP